MAWPDTATCYVLLVASLTVNVSAACFFLLPPGVAAVLRRVSRRSPSSWPSQVLDMHEDHPWTLGKYLVDQLSSCVLCLWAVCALATTDVFQRPFRGLSAGVASVFAANVGHYVYKCFQDFHLRNDLPNFRINFLHHAVTVIVYVVFSLYQQSGLFGLLGVLFEGTVIFYETSKLLQTLDVERHSVALQPRSLHGSSSRSSSPSSSLHSTQGLLALEEGLPAPPTTVRNTLTKKNDFARLTPVSNTNINANVGDDPRYQKFVNTMTDGAKDITRVLMMETLNMSRSTKTRERVQYVRPAVNTVNIRPMTIAASPGPPSQPRTMSRTMHTPRRVRLPPAPPPHPTRHVVTHEPVPVQIPSTNIPSQTSKTHVTMSLPPYDGPRESSQPVTKIIRKTLHAQPKLVCL
ncbi:hypothetical protein Bbelb_034000 [Branchiostoma belcheri]|nr:hypothetical protein Bbelb_034000 [Branchiostoma belcheri]